MSSTEETPLNQAKAPLVDGKKGSSSAEDAATPAAVEEPSVWYIQYAAALAICFYIVVAVTKTMLTKQLLSTSMAPVALSAMSCIVTCLTLVPLFLIKPSTWGMINWQKNWLGFSFVATLVTLDLAFTNKAVALLPVSIQQTLLALNPVFTVIIESFVRRKLNHPVIYLTVGVLMCGPIITNLAPTSDVSAEGVMWQLLGVLMSSLKYIFAGEVMRACKKDAGVFAFLFWLDAATLIILVPWALANGDFYALFGPDGISGGWEWFQLILTSFLGGLRFFSQLLVLKFTTATNLSCANIGYQAINIYLSLLLFHDQEVTAYLICGTLLTLTTSAVYTYWKISKVLTKNPQCIKINDDFANCVTCGGKCTGECDCFSRSRGEGGEAAPPAEAAKCAKA